MKPPAPQTQLQHGLSLLELLVAFSIMAMSVGLLYRSLGGSVSTVSRMERQQQAHLVAESVLALRDAVGPAGWNEAGASAGFEWTVSSRPFVAPLPWPGGPEGAPQLAERIPLHEISLAVSWSEGNQPRQILVTTLLPQRKPFPGETAP